jgi:hypothetical protein
MDMDARPARVPIDFFYDGATNKQNKNQNYSIDPPAFFGRLSDPSPRNNFDFPLPRLRVQHLSSSSSSTSTTDFLDIICWRDELLGALAKKSILLASCVHHLFLSIRSRIGGTF